jgi:uncharacterized protein YlzI (FlbEa/FlbD family)
MDGADHCLITSETVEVEPDIKICKLSGNKDIFKEKEPKF